jgi:hypothetical protein
MTAPLVAKTPYDVDVVAAEIARVASLAKHMPPSWDGAKIAHGFTGTQGENLGRVLPGRGVALASDLKSLGITKPIPYVYEKTLAMKAVEAFGGRERMAIGAASILLGAKLGALGMADALLSLPVFAGAITNYDGIINGRANGKADDDTFFAATQTSVATQWHSIINSNSKFPAGVFAPAAIPGGTATSRATTGALSAGLSNPSGTDLKYLLTVGFTSSSTLNMLILADILVAAGSINANVNTSQTVNTTALTRYTGTASAGNLLTFEVTTALGATASNLTVTSYTNSAGTGSRASSATAMTTSAIVGRLQPVLLGPYMGLQAGDIGVQSVQNVQFSAAMGAGVLNLYIYRPLHFLPGVGASVYVERDSTVQIDGLTELVVGTDSQLGFLTFFVLPNGTSTGNVTAFLRTVAG